MVHLHSHRPGCLRLITLNPDSHINGYKHDDSQVGGPVEPLQEAEAIVLVFPARQSGLPAVLPDWYKKRP